MEIKLPQPVASGTKLFAVLHRDTGAPGRFELELRATEKDPIELIGGKPVAVSFSAN